ncbi:hypothetical protein DDB_G0276161 [Dictyostelium discoideum AX4]|uniref:Putative uncharacterized protein DDB_G0276161 n=1 Tax=Dictyostelium discoideum TaxID=44689 RepID=Y9533_DICDI|nr:hypothetical protein DDB_G0276161 [Dictyostelium discoideum AX4]Q75JF1.1 RecName: Full=Putative uncharacterized protein DDB_G0276161 [Dictyostelium discoideum]EAL69380.1 hypothetical protein DDB_G0276161 [Dictyostelium discoideum AX4]|eukprot:XP_643241.1 hypothetical protein DDB_G0276161 [Dictyostelium discoideum AX4]
MTIIESILSIATVQNNSNNNNNQKTPFANVYQLYNSTILFNNNQLTRKRIR